jgi:pyridoxamine 5'-phosphate oxidase family protein
VPTGYRLDPDSGTLKIGHFSLKGRGQQRLYLRNLTVNPNAAFVVDAWVTDPEWTPSGVTIKGTATLHPDRRREPRPRLRPTAARDHPDLGLLLGHRHPSYEPAVPRKA